MQEDLGHLIQFECPHSKEYIELILGMLKEGGTQEEIMKYSVAFAKVKGLTVKEVKQVSSDLVSYLTARKMATDMFKEAGLPL